MCFSHQFVGAHCKLLLLLSLILRLKLYLLYARQIYILQSLDVLFQLVIMLIDLFLVVFIWLVQLNPMCAIAYRRKHIYPKATALCRSQARGQSSGSSWSLTSTGPRIPTDARTGWEHKNLAFGERKGWLSRFRP